METDYETVLNNLEESERAALECHLTDVGNGKRLAIHFGDRLRYCHDTGAWLYFDGKRWDAKTGNEAAKRYAKDTAKSLLDEAKLKETAHERELTAKWAISSERDARINAMLSMAQSEKPISDYMENFDVDTYAFNCENGVVNLKNFSLLPHMPEFNLTKLAGVKFDETATCPVWDRCVKEWMDGDEEKVGYLQRILGMCLTGDTSARIFPIFYGSGFNGKSKCLDAVMEIMGDYATLGSEELLAEKKFSQHPCDIADLKGRRLVVVDETRKGMKLRTALVKRMTGDQKLKGRLMRQNFEQFNVTHKTIMMTQNLPIINETADAIWDRVHLLKWTVQFPPEKRDPKLMEKFRLEYSGILNWLLEGCKRWQKDGYIVKRPESVETATQQYRKESDQLAEFIEDRCEIGDKYTTTVRAMRDAYEQWVKEKDRYKVSPQNLNAYLREQGAETKVIRHGDKTPMCWTGIGLKGFE